MLYSIYYLHVKVVMAWIVSMKYKLSNLVCAGIKQNILEKRNKAQCYITKLTITNTCIFILHKSNISREVTSKKPVESVSSGRSVHAKKSHGKKSHGKKSHGKKSHGKKNLMLSVI